MTDAEIVNRITASFNRQSAMSAIGATLVDVKPGRVAIRLPKAEHILQQHGFVHGGVIGMIADSACGYAALSLMPADKAVLTGEYKINFLNPAEGEWFEAEGRVLRSGRRVHVAIGDVFACTGQSRKQVAVMLATMMVVDKAPGIVD